MKILGLDFGIKRIGYAVSDPNALIAFPRGALSAKPADALFQRLKIIIEEEGILGIIVGVALGEENEETVLSRKAKIFGRELQKRFGVKVEFIDEFGSTSEALSKIPFKKNRRRKETVDMHAAQIILQRYLDTLPRLR